MTVKNAIEPMLYYFFSSEFMKYFAITHCY